MYGAYALVWHWSFGEAARTSRIIVRAACVGLLVHHIVVYPGNVAALDDPSEYRNTGLFATHESPAASLAHWVEGTTRGDVLPCLERYPAGEPCRYGEVFAAIAGYRRWNDLAEIPIRASDGSGGALIDLSVDPWRRGVFPR